MTIHNNNKVHLNELFSIRVNEVLTIKHMLKNVHWINNNAFAIFGFSFCSAIDNVL